MINRIAICLLLFFFSVSVVHSQQNENRKKKKAEFSNRVGSSKKYKEPIDFSDAIKLNTFKASIKIDVIKGIQVRPRIAFEVFLNDKTSVETGFGAFWNGRRIYNNIYIYQSTNPYYYLGNGPAKGYDGYFEAKYSMNKGIRFINHIGVGFYYRYSNFNKSFTLYELREGENMNVFCNQSETSKIYCIKLTYDADIKGKRWKHFYFNPYISIMPGISYSNVIIEDITYNNGNFPAYHSTEYYHINKQIFTAFKEIGLKLCWGIGKKKELSTKN